MGSVLALAGLLGLAACSNDNDPGPGGVTVGEARALDDAAAMLEDQQRQPPPSASAPAAAPAKPVG
jgi:hypothetical protein